MDCPPQFSMNVVNINCKITTIPQNPVYSLCFCLKGKKLATLDAQQQRADVLKSLSAQFPESLSAAALGSDGGVTWDCRFHCNFGSFALTLGPRLPVQYRPSPPSKKSSLWTRVYWWQLTSQAKLVVGQGTVPIRSKTYTESQTWVCSLQVEHKAVFIFERTRL